MMKMVAFILLLCPTSLFTSVASADIVAENLAAPDNWNAGDFGTGQSFLTGSADKYNQLRVNYFTNNNPVSNPRAFGSLFLLDQEYLGTRASLSALTPGFIAQSTGVENDEFWVFDSAVELSGDTQYWFYTTDNITSVIVSGNSSYADGNAYVADGSGSFSAQAIDFGFAINGNPISVPEPSSIAILGLVGCVLLSRRRKQFRY